MDGLSTKEVQYRINNDLVNNHNIKNSRSVKEIILKNTITLFNFIHIVLFILVLTTGSLINGIFILAIIINLGMGIYQEIKAKYIIDKLKLVSIQKVTVIRDSKEVQISPNEIVVDDLLYLNAGDCLCVDAKIVKSNKLEVDESIITGESDTILKNEDDNIISGTTVISGTAYAKVISINANTYANKLIKEASKEKKDASYLMNNINTILKIITIIIIPIGLSLFFTQFVYGNQSYVDSILSSVAGVIGMIPDGLVLLTSISLTVGVIKMASKNVIIQRLSGIELLACVDTLCLDKTGTITDGSMSVIKTIYKSNINNINNIIANIVQDDINATGIALKNEFKIEKELKIKEKIPFSSKRKYSQVEFNDGIFAIGALEFLTNKQLNDYDELEEYISCGYRVLTMVKFKNNEFNKNDNEVVAFIILKDNLRNNAKETLEYFKKQNVKIKIISGDNPQTVSNLLKQIDIDNSDLYISGENLPNDYSSLIEVVNKYKIFGRITPEQKKEIVKILKKNETVGYIGDGVNDILALKEADCGIALANGTSAARNVSEVVLTDADFSILPLILNEGRRVVNNIERVASMYLIKTTYSFLISLLCIIIGCEYPFFPVQLSLISSICVGIPSFFLAIEPNYEKVSKGFLVKVMRNALPSGLCVFFNIFFLIIISYIFKINFDYLRFVVVFTTGYISLRLLYNVSKPLNLLRKILVITCFILFYIILFVFKDLVLISHIKFWALILSLVIIFSNNYVIEFFEIIYDKTINMLNKYKKNKRGVTNEN